MHDVLVLPSAQADLDDIAIYTKEQWGREQARRYLATLRSDITGLARFPRMHPAYESRHGKFRKMASGEHLVFFIVNEAAVEVVRVLHNRMDVEEALA